MHGVDAASCIRYGGCALLWQMRLSDQAYCHKAVAGSERLVLAAARVPISANCMQCPFPHPCTRNIALYMRIVVSVTSGCTHVN